MALKELLLQTLRQIGDPQPKNIIYKDDNVQRLILQWTENENWTPYIFLSIMHQLGVVAPLTLKSTEKESFSCIAGNGETYEVELRFSDPIDFPSGIWLTKGNETKGYTVCKGKNCLDGPRIEEGTTTIKWEQDGKEMQSNYSIYSCMHTLKMGVEHYLKVQIDEPNFMQTYESGEVPKVLGHREEVEKYLQEVAFPVNVKQVMGKILELLEFTDEDLKGSRVVLVAYQNRPTATKMVRDFCLMQYGKEQGYEELNHVFSFPKK